MLHLSAAEYRVLREKRQAPRAHPKAPQRQDIERRRDKSRQNRRDRADGKAFHGRAQRAVPDDKAGYWAHCFIIYSIEQSAYKSILVVMSKAGVSLLFIHSGV